MPGLVTYVLGLLAVLLDVSVVVCALSKNLLRRYFTIILYMALSAVVDVCRYWVIAHSGLSSSMYFYFYYYSDALLTICLYFALMGLYAIVLEELKADLLLRLGTLLLLAGTAWFSYGVIQQSSNKMLTHFVVELSQNLYFVGLVLTYVLWGATMKLRESRTRVIQLVLSLGVYFSAFAATYALRNLYPQMHMIWAYVPPVLGCLLPLAWAYTFWRMPEDARLAPARLAPARLVAVPR